jgi:acyl phosphate:glycerol-3-phosphate acyltransferase
MDGTVVISVAVIGYLLGSISFARIVTRFLSPQRDITDYEIPVAGTPERYKVISIGANSVALGHGRKAGMLVSILDIAKIALPTWLCQRWFPHQPYHLLLAVTGMAGHIWPIFHRFHGGSGFSPVLGGMLVIDWLGALITPIAGLLLGMVVLRNIVVASLSWMWLLIPWMWFRTYDLAHIAYAVAVNILFVLAMLPEYKMALKFQKEGKLEAYARGSLESNPMGRGLLRLAAFFKIPVR